MPIQISIVIQNHDSVVLGRKIYRFCNKIHFYRGKLV